MDKTHTQFSFVSLRSIGDAQTGDTFTKSTFAYAMTLHPAEMFGTHCDRIMFAWWFHNMKKSTGASVATIVTSAI